MAVQIRMKAPLLRSALCALTCVATVVVAAPASAQTLTFASAACSGASSVNVPSPYVESGFTLTSPGTSPFATWCAGNSNHPGTPALFINTSGAAATLTKNGGGTFSLSAIDLAQLFAGPQNAETLTFIGTLFGGGTVSQSFTIPSQAGGSPTLATYTFAPTFANLTSVSFATQVAPYYQFTNVQLGAVSAVPEPATMALVATGLLALAGIARRRRG